MEKINVAEAQDRLAELVDRAASGETILIARDGAPAARLVPANDVEAKRPYFDAEKFRKRLEDLPMDTRSPEEIDAELRSLDRY